MSRRKPLPAFCGPYRVIGEVPGAPNWIRMMCVCGIEHTILRRRIFNRPTSCGCRLVEAAKERQKRTKSPDHADDRCRMTMEQLDAMIATRRATMLGNDRLPARDDTRNATRIVNLVRMGKHWNGKTLA